MNCFWRPGWSSLGVVWVVAVGVGLLAMLHYETAPGPRATAAALWPADSRVPLDPELPTLVMLAHPRCPCTRASLDELGQILAQAPGRVRAHVLFWQPAGAAEGWDRTDLWRTATALTGVAVAADCDGAEAGRFGARTSGQVVVYHPDGRRLFVGGITGARGHSGVNAGRDAVVAILDGAPGDVTEFPVFGCALFNPSARERQDPLWRN